MICGSTDISVSGGTDIPVCVVARPSRRAFSLVELLVVLGIISVLISILLPALAAARRQSRSVACLSNVRQLAAGFRLYAEDYQGHLPGPSEAWEDLLRAYVPSPQSYVCPADADGLDKATGLSYAWRDDIATMDPDASLSGQNLFSAGADVVLIFDVSPTWHGQQIRNASAVDTSARKYDADDFRDNLQRRLR